MKINSPMAMRYSSIWPNHAAAAVTTTVDADSAIYTAAMVTI